ncbi:MAG: rhamnulokinase [Anaerolineaceae bacterium]|nr:rhamnulokinase [Anaerolineaceae bacterium]
MHTKNVLAVDLGAESGRVVRVGFDGSQFSLEEIHRFPNTPVQARGTLHWDVLRLWHEITTGIQAAGSDTAGIGVDTWGVDFALLDRNGNLLSNPVHYRDSRTDGMFDWVFERVPRRTVFERTGIQFMVINSLYQLASMVKNNSPLLDITETLLPIPDLFNYWLSGTKSAEFSHVSTFQCYNPHSGNWDYDTLQALGLPTDILPTIIQPGTRIGDYQAIPVIAPATHDTGCAVAAVPTTTANYAYLSSGTWSLIGLEVQQPVINDDSYAANVTNEGGVYGTFRLLKNVMGLWLAQQCRATWQQQGQQYTYDQLTQAAAAADPFVSLVDPDHASFLAPGDMPTRIAEFCARTNQPQPQSTGQFMRCVYESLALKYRYALDRLVRLTGQPVEHLHIIGGGSQNKLLNQMAADATGRVVIAGPVEATALGNAIVQFITLGELQDIAQAREILSQTMGTETYTPRQTAEWEDAYQRFTTYVEDES